MAKTRREFLAEAAVGLAAAATNAAGVAPAEAQDPSQQQPAGAPPAFGTGPGVGPQVFIGKKSPVTKSENLSVIGGNYRVGDAMVSIFAIGPKRMDYKKTIRVFRSL